MSSKWLFVGKDKPMNVAQRQNEVIAAAGDPINHGIAFFVTILDSEDDPLCKWYALKAIGDIRGIEAKKQLLNTLKQPDYKVGESSLHRICSWAIGRIGLVLTSDLINLLNDLVSEQVRIAIIDAW